MQTLVAAITTAQPRASSMGNQLRTSMLILRHARLKYSFRDSRRRGVLPGVENYWQSGQSSRQKLMKKLLYITGLALGGITMAFANNGDRVLSPRAESQITRIVPAEKMAKSDKCTSCCPESAALSPRAGSQQIILGEKSNDPDLAHRSSTLSPRAQAQEDRAERDHDVPPLKQARFQ